MTATARRLYPFFAWLISLPVMCTLNSCATTQSARSNTLSKSQVSSLIVQRKADAYTIQVGDEIEIAVWGYEDFNVTKTVTTYGVVVVPHIGEVKAEGLSKEELEANLRKQLSEYIKGEINLSLTIASAQNNIVSVLGSVGRPDNYQLLSGVSLFEILSRAGGTTDQADISNIKIFQEGNVTDAIEVDLTTYLKKGNEKNVAMVQPGDIVYVPLEKNMVRELSSFARDVVLLFGLFRVFN